MNKYKNKPVYILSLEDIQNVSMEEIGRELSLSEINSVVEELHKRMPWYEIISDSITEVLSEQELDKKY